MPPEPTNDGPGKQGEPEQLAEPAETSDADLGEKGEKALEAWKTRARNAEKKAKELEPLAARAKELEEAQKTNEQKLTEALDAAKADATTSKAELLRLRVGLDKGVPAALVKFLPSGTQEEVEAAADELLASLPTTDGPRRPQPNPEQGRTPTTREDPDAWLRDMARNK
jgi:hypothetical protein